MRTKPLVLVALMLLSAVFTLDANATALRVIVVETEDVDAYVKQVARGQALLKSMNSPTVVRVWRARYAGEDAGTIVVSLEYADMAALAADEKMTKESAEWQAWMKELSKVRKIVSDSLYEELTEELTSK